MTTAGTGLSPEKSSVLSSHASARETLLNAGTDGRNGTPRVTVHHGLTRRLIRLRRFFDLET
jgi:hypothetical protein